VDVALACRALRSRKRLSLRYDGFVGCEYRPVKSTTAGLSWLYRLLDRKPAAVS